MFEKLIESMPASAETKGRRAYFAVSSIVVGIVFTIALVTSIYAAAIDLGTSGFEYVEMLAPMTADAPEPERPEPQPRRLDRSRADIPTRAANIARIDEIFDKVIPNSVSVVRNSQMERPKEGRFVISRLGDTHGTPAGRTTSDAGDIADRGGLSSSIPETRSEKDTDTTPPPVVKMPPAKPQSLGVVNGRASHLPKPEYPAPAIAVGAEGKVNVQVTIDEDGNVVAANAVSGHPLLRAAAQNAARRARFTPTYLSKVPVKVTGVIVYNFTR